MIKELDNSLELKEFNVEEKNPFTKYIAYYIDNIVVGYLVYLLIYDRVEIDYIFVKEEYRSRKIASNMLEYLIDISKKQNVFNITLEVRENNENAIKLYTKYGFKKVAIRKGYYEGIDGLLMELIL